jgi:hypothetical protein
MSPLRDDAHRQHLARLLTIIGLPMGPQLTCLHPASGLTILEHHNDDWPSLEAAGLPLLQGQSRFVAFSKKKKSKRKKKVKRKKKKRKKTLASA